MNYIVSLETGFDYVESDIDSAISRRSDPCNTLIMIVRNVVKNKLDLLRVKGYNSVCLKALFKFGLMKLCDECLLLSPF